MTKNQLQKKISALNINENMYSINGELKEDACILDYSNGTWYVFYFERGDRFLEKKFSQEAYACSYFWELLKRHTYID